MSDGQTVSDRSSDEEENESDSRGYLDKSDYVCLICEKEGDLLLCDGPCLSSFHIKCLGLKDLPDSDTWMCEDCTTKRHPCFYCKKKGPINSSSPAKHSTESKYLRKCCAISCGKFYHAECIRQLPLSRIMDGGRFICPLHTCGTCQISGKNTQSTRCTRCPTTFHKKCVPKKGCKKIMSNRIVCPKHVDEIEKPKEEEVKVTEEQEDEEEEVVFEPTDVVKVSMKKLKKKKKKKKKKKHRQSLEEAGNVKDPEEIKRQTLVDALGHSSDDDEKPPAPVVVDSIAVPEPPLVVETPKPIEAAPLLVVKEEKPVVATEPEKTNPETSVEAIAQSEIPVQEPEQPVVESKPPIEPEPTTSQTPPPPIPAIPDAVALETPIEEPKPPATEPEIIETHQVVVAAAPPAEPIECIEPAAHPEPVIEEQPIAILPPPPEPIEEKPEPLPVETPPPPPPAAPVSVISPVETKQSPEKTPVPVEVSPPPVADDEATVPAKPSRAAAAVANTKLITKPVVKKEIQWVQCDQCKKWRTCSVDLKSLPEKWYCKMNTWNIAYSTCAAAEEVASTNTEGTKLKELQWVQCEHSSCGKWRSAPADLNLSTLPEKWYCSMNTWNRKLNSCSIPNPPDEKMFLMQKKTSKAKGRPPKRPSGIMLSPKKRKRSKTKKKHVWQWVQCEKCDKWRRLPSTIDSSSLPEKWYCSMNTWDIALAKCSAKQENDQDISDPDSPLNRNLVAVSSASNGNTTGKKEKGGKLSYRELIFGSNGLIRKAYNEESSRRIDSEGKVTHRDDQYRYSSRYLSPKSKRGANKKKRIKEKPKLSTQELQVLEQVIIRHLAQQSRTRLELAILLQCEQSTQFFSFLSIAAAVDVLTEQGKVERIPNPHANQLLETDNEPLYRRVCRRPLKTRKPWKRTSGADQMVELSVDWK